MASIKPIAKTGPEISSFDFDTYVVLDSFKIDASIDETHDQAATWTQYPVSSGVKISDHSQAENARFSMTGEVSNQPINEGDNTTLQGADRVKQADTLLLGWTRAGVPIQMITGLRVYGSLGITNYSVNRNAQNGQGLSFTLELQEVRLVSAETTEIPDAVIRADTAPAAQGKTDGGTQTGTQTTPDDALAGEAASRDKSVAAGLFDGLGNMGG